MKKSNLISLIFAGAVGVGAPYAVLDHEAQAADNESLEAPKLSEVASEAPKEAAVSNEVESTTQPKEIATLPKESASENVARSAANVVENSAQPASENATEKPESSEVALRSATETSEQPVSENATRSAASASVENSATDLDVKNLKDGEYTLGVNTSNYYTDGVSMSGAAINHTAKLLVRDGEYFVNVDFQPIERKLGAGVFRGYLGNLKYYYGDKTGGRHENAADNIKDEEFVDGKIVEFYPTDKKDDYFDKYKEKYPERTAYPKTIEYKVDQNKIADDKKLKTYGQVFVPVMDLFNAGVQNVNVIFDFNTLKVVKLKEEKPAVVESKYVSVSVKDDTITTPKVRKNVDKVARLEKVGNEEYLYLTYLSENKGDGLANIKYAFAADAKDKETPEVKVLDKVVLRDGEDESVYEVSEAKIKVTGHNEVVVFGDFQYPSGKRVQYGTITWTEKDNLVSDDVKVSAPKLFSLKPVLRGVVEKTEGESRQFDFTSGGVTYSPYNGINGDKFKLANNYFFNLELNFERDSFSTTKTRHIKYTLDGSEPTFASNDAIIGFANADKYKPEFSYRMTVDPFDKAAKFDNNRVLTLKVKAFNADGSESSETITYALPFDNETFDKVSTKATINNKEYDATLSSDRKFYFDDNSTFKVSTISEKALVASLDKQIEDLGLSNATMFKVDIINKDGSKYTPVTKEGWNIEENPIFKLSLAKFAGDKDTFVYVYENGQLRLVPATASAKELNFNVNSDEAYFVVAKKDAAKVAEEEVALLKAKVEEVNKALSATTSVSAAKANLEAELAKVEKTLKRKKPTLNAVILHVENLDKNLKSLNSEKEADLSYLQSNAKALSEITEAGVLKEVVSADYLAKLEQLRSKVNSSLNDATALAQNLKDLQGALNNLEYKYPTQDVDFSVKKFYRPEDTSMANNVFENKGKLIFTPTKTYLAIDLKTMLFGSMHAHLLDLDLFKDKLDGEKLPYYVVNRYDDINSLNGEVGNFAKKLLVELDKDVKESYDIRVPNDGMGSSRPEAKLVIATKVERPEVIIDKDKEAADRLEKERLEKEAREKAKREAKEKAEREQAEKFVKENVEKLKEQAVANIAKEVANLPKEEKEKIEKIINSAIGTDTLAITVEGTAVVVALDNSKTQAEKVEVKTLSEEKQQKVENIVAQKISEKAEVVNTYDINLLAKDGNVVKQDGTTAVTIAVVKNEDEELKVYYVKDDNTLELVPSVYVDGKLTFFTTHFSTYTIVKTKKQADNNGNQNNGDNGNNGNQNNGDNENNGGQNNGDNENNGNQNNGSNGNNGNQNNGSNGNNGSQNNGDNGNNGSQNNGDNGNNGSQNNGDNENNSNQNNGSNENNGSQNNGGHDENQNDVECQDATENTVAENEKIPTNKNAKEEQNSAKSEQNKVKNNALPKTTSATSALGLTLIALVGTALVRRRKQK